MYRRLISPKGERNFFVSGRLVSIVFKKHLFSPHKGRWRLVSSTHATLPQKRQAALLLVLLVFYVNLPKNAFSWRSSGRKPQKRMQRYAFVANQPNFKGKFFAENETFSRFLTYIKRLARKKMVLEQGNAYSPRFREAESIFRLPIIGFLTADAAW